MLANLFKSGEWKSSHRCMGVKYNTNVWWLIPDSYDDHDGSLFGVMDRNDGSSFSIDLSYVEEGEVYDYEWCESEYFSRLFNISNDTREIDRFPLRIGDIEFQCVAYSFQNKQFGEQVVLRGISIGESVVVGVSMAWPKALTFDGSDNLPPKHALLVDSFELSVDLNGEH